MGKGVDEASLDLILGGRCRSRRLCFGSRVQAQTEQNRDDKPRPPHERLSLMEVIVMPRVHQTSDLEFPSSASANGPLNLRRCCVDELRNEFQVPAVQEVMAH